LGDPRVKQAIHQSLHDDQRQLLQKAYIEMLDDDAKVHNYLADQILRMAPSRPHSDRSAARPAILAKSTMNQDSQVGEGAEAGRPSAQPVRRPALLRSFSPIRCFHSNRNGPAERRPFLFE